MGDKEPVLLALYSIGLIENSESDGGEGQVVPGVDDGRVAIVADSYSAQAFDPAYGSFGNPAKFSQTAAVRRDATANNWREVHK